MILRKRLSCLVWGMRRRAALRERSRRTARALKELLWPIVGVAIRIDAPDREELEQRILPWLASRPELQRVLFVGCGPYTKHYERIFRGREYWTIDVDPSRKRFGAGRRHVVGSVVELSRHFDSAALDLVVFNGILGFGLDEREEIERAFGQVARALRRGGVLVLGWDDNPPRRPVYPEEIAALAEFDRLPVPFYDSWRHVVAETAYRKTYDFYRRAADA